MTMTTLTKQEFITELYNFEEIIEQADRTSFALQELFGGDCGSVDDTIGSLQDSVTGLLNKLSPLPDDTWVSDFIWDHAFGEQALECVDSDGIEWVITSIEKFADFMYGMD